MDIETFRNGLNKAINGEYLAVMTYQLYGASLIGYEREIFKEIWMGESHSELDHAEFFAEKIYALDGTVVPNFSLKGLDAFSPLPGVDFEIGDINFALRQLLKMESETIVLYKSLVEAADVLGYHDIAVGIESILEDEREHYENLKMTLQKI